jgi:hypothetical protein
MSVRSAVGVFCVSTLVAGGLAPAASAAGRHGHDSSELSVTVCKRIRDDHGHHGDHHGDHRGHRDRDFDFFAKTDSDWDNFTVRAGDCEDLTFSYDDNKFFLKEKDSGDYRVHFRVFGDDEDSWSNGNRLWVRFDDNDDPYLRIIVINERTHGGDHHGGHHGGHGGGHGGGGGGHRG